MKKNRSLNIGIGIAIGIVISFIVFLVKENLGVNNFFTQESILNSETPEFLEKLRDPSVHVDLGERKMMSPLEFAAEEKNFKEWNKRNRNPRSRRNDRNNKRNPVITTTSFSFGINQIESLLADVIDYDSEHEIITGFRIQLYESMNYDDSKKNLIDAIIVPVKANGDVVTYISKNNEAINDSSTVKLDNVTLLTLNASNPCPDHCEPD